MRSLGLILLLSACSIGVPVSGEVQVRHTLDLTETEKFFEEACKDELGYFASQAEIQACVNEAMINFLEIFK